MQIEDIKNNVKTLKGHLAALAETRARIPKLTAKREKTEKQIAALAKIDPLADDSADLIQRKAALEKQILLIDEEIAGGTGLGTNEAEIIGLCRELHTAYGSCAPGIEKEKLGQLRKIAESEEMKSLFLKWSLSDNQLRALPAFEAFAARRRSFGRFVERFLYPEFKNDVELLIGAINEFIGEIESYLSTGKFEKFLA